MRSIIEAMAFCFAIAVCGGYCEGNPGIRYIPISHPATSHITAVASPPASNNNSDFEPLIPRFEEGDEFQLEHFLCDFDYLMYILRNNFPLFGVAYRRFGVDIDVVEARTRRAIIYHDITDANDFSRLLNYYFFRPFGGFGHLFQNCVYCVHLVLANIYRATDRDGNIIFANHQVIYDVLTSPQARRFYGEIEIALGEYEIDMVVEDNLRTGILVPGEVAYVNVNVFSHYNIDHDREIIFAFYEEIADFGHLIIDLRENPGGFMHYFHELFVLPNISTNLRWNEVEFIPAGRTNMIYADAFIAEMRAWNRTSVRVDSVSAFIARHNMQHVNQDDLQMLDYAVTWRHWLTPSNRNIAFGGKIWILIGPNSASAVEAIAIFARETGFATLVGAPTAGVMASMSTYVALPNSGIIVRYDMGYMVDAWGRSQEEFGIQPHYFTRRRMSAIDTVLALIREGRY